MSAQQREMDHHYRIVDMMLSIHSMLRDRNSKLARRVDIANMVLSTLLVGTTFADLAFADRLGVAQDHVRLTIGVLAIGVFLLALAATRMDWIARGMRHASAAERLAELKLKCRAFRMSPAEFAPEQWKAQNQETAWVLRTLAPIPDALFNKYRHKHYRKIQINKLFDERPGLPYWMGALFLTWRALRRTKVQATREELDPKPPRD